MTIIILSIMMMMTYDDNVLVWGWHSHNFIILFIIFIYFICLFIFDNYNTIVLNNINWCCYHDHLCHLLQNFYHHHHHITSSTFNVSIVTLYESSAPFLFANHQHHLYHLIYWSSSVSSPLIIIYLVLHHYHN